MTSPVALIALTYAGTDVQSIPGTFLELSHGLNESPEVRGVDTVVPGSVGKVAGSRILNRLPILLEGRVLGTSASDFRVKMLALRLLFDPARIPAALVATLENGQTATVTARPLNIAAGQTTPWTADVSVELEALADWVIA